MASRGDGGSPVPSGPYYYQIRADGDATDGRMQLFR